MNGRKDNRKEVGQGGQPAKPLGVYIAGVPGVRQGFKFSEQAGLLTLVLTLFAGKGLYGGTGSGDTGTSAPSGKRKTRRTGGTSGTSP